MSILISFRRSFSSKRFEASYNLLKVKRHSSQEEIRQAYLKLIKIYHPDNLKTGNDKRFMRIREAYERIKDAPLLNEKIVHKLNCDKEELSYKAHLRHRKPSKEPTIERRGLYNSITFYSSLFDKFLNRLLPSKRRGINSKTNLYKDKY